jgi:hypothetical protein
VLKKPISKRELVKTVATAVATAYHDNELTFRLLSS